MNVKVLLLCVVACLNLHASKPHTMDFGRCKCACRDENEDVGQIEDPFGGARGPPGPPGKQGPPGSGGEGGVGGLGTAANPAASCSHLKDNDVNDDGVYFIKMGPMAATTQVYCDMTITRNGKAWSLVASIHDNNAGKCLDGDKWSSELGLVQGRFHSSHNWENTNVFGNVESAASSDYKNSQYFNAQAGNVMVWHVPNNTPLSQYKQQATLIYVTDDDFLGGRGGNLRGLYKDHYPLVLQDKDSLPRLADVVGFLGAVTGGDLTSGVADVFRYTVGVGGGEQTFISDGGQDMFDDGNMISFSLGESDFEPLVYGTPVVYPDPLNLQVGSNREFPFVALAWIGISSENRFRFRVTSNLGADGKGSLSSVRGGVERGSFRLFFASQQAHGSGDASVVKIYFFVSNRERWGSMEGARFEIEEEATTSAEMNHQVVLQSQSPLKNLLFGYILLSKQPGSDNELSGAEMEDVLGRVLDSVAAADAVVPLQRNQGCGRLNESLAVPVRYLRGGDDDVISVVPAELRADVVPGFLHFRAFGNRIPTALCPGFKSETCANQGLCVGGVSAGTTGGDLGFVGCGDFAGPRRSPHSIFIFYDT